MKRELVAGLIIRDGKVLLLENTKHGRSRIEPPGGKVHDGEGFQDSLKREVMEEIGVEAEVRGIFGTYPTTTPEGGFEVHMFLCEIKGEPVLKEPEKFSGFGWYGYGDLVRIKGEGSLVENMVKALPQLKGLL